MNCMQCYYKKNVSLFITNTRLSTLYVDIFYNDCFINVNVVYERIVFRFTLLSRNLYTIRSKCGKQTLRKKLFLLMLYIIIIITLQ